MGPRGPPGMHTLSSRRGDISPSGAPYDGFREGEWQLVEYRGVGLRATICRLLGGEAKNAGASECVSRYYTNLLYTLLNKRSGDPRPRRTLLSSISPAHERCDCPMDLPYLSYNRAIPLTQWSCMNSRGKWKRYEGEGEKEVTKPFNLD